MKRLLSAALAVVLALVLSSADAQDLHQYSTQEALNKILNPDTLATTVVNVKAGYAADALYWVADLAKGGADYAPAWEFYALGDSCVFIAILDRTNALGNARTDSTVYSYPPDAGYDSPPWHEAVRGIRVVPKSSSVEYQIKFYYRR